MLKKIKDLTICLLDLKKKFNEKSKGGTCSDITFVLIDES